MCGRFTLIDLSQFTDVFPWILPPVRPPEGPRYNIAPTQGVAVVPNTRGHRIDYFQWGLVPSWAKDPKIGSKMINARAETVADRPAYRTALRRRRCVVPTSGFYEWRKDADGKKTPMYIRMKDGRPFGMAGLWDIWPQDNGSELGSFTIITTEANELIRPIHDRMPVILHERDFRRWLEPDEVEPEAVIGVLRPYESGKMVATPVSRRVNNVREDSAACIEGMTEGDESATKKADESPGLFG
jgi:putative SOS response-associated peptidase YedK